MYADSIALVMYLYMARCDMQAERAYCIAPAKASKTRMALLIAKPSLLGRPLQKNAKGLARAAGYARSLYSTFYSLLS